jgi:DNA-binding LacI/PurR family transcriptional regulator
MAKKMLKLSEPPTAIFAASDTQAMGVIQAANELNIEVPINLSVIGYDDIEIAEYLGLTTIRQLLFESGQRGVELLLRMLETPSSPPILDILPNELIIRRTTAPVSH